MCLRRVLPCLFLLATCRHLGNVVSGTLIVLLGTNHRLATVIRCGSAYPLVPPSFMEGGSNALESSRMRLSSVTRVLLFLLVVGFVAVSTGCGGGNGTGEEARARDSTIQGNVAQVLAALRPSRERPSFFARWHEVFPLVPAAHAQAATLAGITVVARQGSITLDTARTDAAGDFTLQVASGTVTLVFTTASFTVSTALTVPARTTVVLVVILQPTQVIVPTQVVVVEGESAPIHCTGGRIRLLDETQNDVVIDGGGEDCIRAEGQCTIDLAFRSLTLTNCERCIRAEGNADVLLTTGGGIRCTAFEDGIRAEGTSSVTLDAASLTIAAGEHGIRAEGEADVVLDVPTCAIDGREKPVRIEGRATVDGCGL